MAVHDRCVDGTINRHVLKGERSILFKLSGHCLVINGDF